MLKEIKQKEKAYLEAKERFQRDIETFIGACESRITIGMLSDQVVGVLSELALIRTPETTPYHESKGFEYWVRNSLFKWDKPLDEESLKFCRCELRRYILSEILNDNYGLPLPENDY